MENASRSVIQAIDRGFWPRLMGYISAARNPDPGRIVELAGRIPTSVTLSRTDAAALLAIGQQARTAAKSWLAGTPILQIEPPQLAIPASPNIEGGQPGRYEIGLLIRPQTPDGQPIPAEVPVVFSSACRGSVQDCIDTLMDFAETIGSDTPSLNKYINAIIDNWLYGRANLILPNWLLERIDHNIDEIEG